MSFHRFLETSNGTSHGKSALADQVIHIYSSSTAILFAMHRNIVTLTRPLVHRASSPILTLKRTSTATKLFFSSSSPRRVSPNSDPHKNLPRRNRTPAKPVRRVAPPPAQRRPTLDYLRLTSPGSIYHEWDESQLMFDLQLNYLLYFFLLGVGNLILFGYVLF